MKQSNNKVGDRSNGQFPSIESLATLAALLVRHSYEDPERMVSAAWGLWLAARKKVLLADHAGDVRKQDEEIEELLLPVENFFIKSEDKLPITRDYFLNKVLPSCKNRSAELAQIGKAYIRNFRGNHPGRTLMHDDDVAEAYRLWGEEPYGDIDQANREARRFNRWRKQDIKQKRTSAGLASARRRVA
jgi:hypothetical protein